MHDDDLPLLTDQQIAAKVLLGILRVETQTLQVLKEIKILLLCLLAMLFVVCAFVILY